MCLALTRNKVIVKYNCPIYSNQISILTYLFQRRFFSRELELSHVFVFQRKLECPYFLYGTFSKECVRNVQCVYKGISMILIHLFLMRLLDWTF